MDEITTPAFLLAAGFLVASGLAKVRNPRPARDAIRAVGIPSTMATARLLGLYEVCLGGFALLAPQRLLAVGVGITYVVFAAFLVFLIVRRPESSSCGCIGSRDVPPTPLHVAYNVLAAASAFVAASYGSLGPTELFGMLGPSLAVLTIFLLLTAHLLYASVIHLPQLYGAYQPTDRASPSGATEAP